jgi:hypothetical protein
MGAFLGMRGNGDWVTDQRPKNWRETMLFLYPNGSMPLTAIMSKMKSEKTKANSTLGAKSPRLNGRNCWKLLKPF